MRLKDWEHELLSTPVSPVVRDTTADENASMGERSMSDGYEFDGTQELMAELGKLGVDSHITHTGGGCFVLCVEIKNGWTFETSRPDGVEYGYSYSVKDATEDQVAADRWGPESGPAEVAQKMLKRLAVWHVATGKLAKDNESEDEIESYVSDVTDSAIGFGHDELSAVKNGLSSGAIKLDGSEAATAEDVLSNLHHGLMVEFVSTPYGVLITD